MRTATCFRSFRSRRNLSPIFLIGQIPEDPILAMQALLFSQPTIGAAKCVGSFEARCRRCSECRQCGPTTAAENCAECRLWAVAAFQCGSDGHYWKRRTSLIILSFVQGPFISLRSLRVYGCRGSCTPNTLCFRRGSYNVQSFNGASSKDRINDFRSTRRASPVCRNGNVTILSNWKKRVVPSLV